MRKLLVCIALVGVCLFAAAAPGAATPPRCESVCCMPFDPDTECTLEYPLHTTTCYYWWNHSFGMCP
jgi:hypothetical protein